VTVVLGVDFPVGRNGKWRISRSDRLPEEMLIPQSTALQDGVDAPIFAVGVNHVVAVNGRRVDTLLEAIVVCRICARVLELPLRN